MQFISPVIKPLQMNLCVYAGYQDGAAQEEAGNTVGASEKVSSEI